MTSEKNRTFLARQKSMERTWTFTIPYQHEDSESHSNQTKLLLDQIYHISNSFLKIKSIEFVLHYSSQDLPIESLATHDNSDSTYESLSDQSGLKWDDISSEIDKWISGYESLLLARISVTDADVKIRLEDGDHWIGIDSDRYRTCSADSVLDEKPNTSPVSLVIFDDMGENLGEYKLFLSTVTDIWFEHTELGECNRTRLGRTIAEIRDTFPPCSIEIESESWIEEQGFDSLLV